MKTCDNSTPTLDVNPTLFEGVTLLRALADLADPVLRKHDKPDANDNATSRHSRFRQLVSMLEGKLIAVARELDRQSLKAVPAGLTQNERSIPQDWLAGSQDSAERRAIDDIRGRAYAEQQTRREEMRESVAAALRDGNHFDTPVEISVKWTDIRDGLPTGLESGMNLLVRRRSMAESRSVFVDLGVFDGAEWRRLDGNHFDTPVEAWGIPS